MMDDHQQSDKFYRKLDEYRKKPWTIEEMSKVADIITEGRKNVGKEKDRRLYNTLSNYDVIVSDDNTKSIIKKSVKTGDQIPVVPYERLYVILNDLHVSTGHGARYNTRINMFKSLKGRYFIPRLAIETYLEVCFVCKEKFGKTQTQNTDDNQKIRNSGVTPGNLDIINFKNIPDEDFKFVLCYQDIDSRFIYLRPLKSDKVAEIANELLKLFLTIGTPSVIQSGKGSKFDNRVVKTLTELWPQCKIVHGDIKIPSIEIKELIKKWMKDSKSNSWTKGCYFVQWDKNSVGRTPLEAMFDNQKNRNSGVTRGNLDVINFQNIPDEEFKFVLSYQDIHSRFICLRPLKSDEVAEIANELLKLFLTIGTPSVIQSGKGKIFVNSVVKKLTERWPQCKIVHGKLLKNVQSSGTNIKRPSVEIKELIRKWMKDAKSNSWTKGCYFVQWNKNSVLDETLGRTPFEAMFDRQPSKTNNQNNITSEEELNELIKGTNPGSSSTQSLQEQTPTQTHIPTSSMQLSK